MLRSFFRFAPVALATLCVVGAANAQLEDWGFDANGNPVRLSDSTPPATPAAHPAAPSAPTSSAGQPAQGAPPAAEPLVTPPATPADEPPDEETGSPMAMLVALLALVIVAFAVFAYIRRPRGEEDEKSDDGRRRLVPNPPTTPGLRPAPTAPSPTPPSKPTPLPPTPPSKPVKDDRPTLYGPTGRLLSLVVLAAMAGAGNVAAFESVSVYPGVAAPGTSTTSILTAQGFSLQGVVSCRIAILGVGCSVDSIRNNAEAMLRINVAGSAAVLQRGQLMLVFSNGTTRVFPAAFLTGSKEQIATAQLAPHVIPRPAPASAPTPAPKPVPSVDRTARDAAVAAARTAQTAQDNANGLRAQLEAANAELQQLRAAVLSVDSNRSSTDEDLTRLANRVTELGDQIRQVNDRVTSVVRSVDSLASNQEAMGGEVSAARVEARAAHNLGLTVAAATVGTRGGRKAAKRELREILAERRSAQ